MIKTILAAFNWQTALVYGGLILLLVLMLVPSLVQNKKASKQYSEMLSSLAVGDTIQTIGGVIGRILKISKTDRGSAIILETGAKGKKVTLEFDMSAIATVIRSEKAKDGLTGDDDTKLIEDDAAEKQEAEETKTETTENKAPATKKTSAAKSKTKKASR